LLLEGQEIIGLLACDPRGLIGNQGKLPWSYPQELDYFRRTTYQQMMIMGRKTFESTPPNILKDRLNIVFSRKKRSPWSIQNNIIFVSSLESFLNLKVGSTYKVAYMIGGAEIAELFLAEGLLSEFLLTKIHQYHQGDTFFSLEFLESWSQELLCTEKDFSIYRYKNPNKIK